MRTFSLNSREFYEAVTPAPAPHVWAEGLPREPRWPRPEDRVWVAAEDDEAARDAVREWIECVEAGRIG
jgi:hypothetical protein